MNKAKVQQIIDAESDDIDVDALIERLYLLRKIELAEEQLASGQGIHHDDAKRRLATWLK